PEPLGGEPREQPGLELAHREDRLEARGAGVLLVVVQRVEVPAGAREAHDVRPRQRPDPQLHHALPVSISTSRWRRAISPAASRNSVSSVTSVMVPPRDPSRVLTSATTRRPES